MAGSVWERCRDRYAPETHGAYRMLCGGWCDEHWSCRVSVRSRSRPASHTDDVGSAPTRSAPRILRELPEHLPELRTGAVLGAASRPWPCRPQRPSRASPRTAPAPDGVRARTSRPA